jgi:NAD(P)-dependent dehydrogenase (short-subunit alcohol dehydrogenase family)
MIMQNACKRFASKVAFITGAGSGIGRRIALRLAQEGADIAISDLVAEKLQETVQLVESCGQKALALPADVGNLQEMEQAANKAIEAFGKIDILVNNAGTGDTNMSFEDLEAEIWDRVYATNVKGPFFLTKIIAKDMISKGVKGKIINIASTEGKTNRAGSLAYASSKSALIGLTQGLAIQLSPYEITVNAVCPGLIDTPIWHRGDKVMDLPPGSMIKMVVDTAIEQRQLKIARVGTPDDIAAAVSFLVSDDASYMTGQAINVCGGMEFH